jgi:hypothetical protein
MKKFKESCGQKFNQMVCEESGTGVLVGDRLSILVGAALRAGEGAEKKQLTCRAARRQ